MYIYPVFPHKFPVSMTEQRRQCKRPQVNITKKLATEMEKGERERKQGSAFRLSSLRYYLVCAQYHLLHGKTTIIQVK